MEEHIYIKGARQNNLKGFDLQLPLHKLIVVTGISGSGKSSLAFDTVYSEGQRRYFETFSAYTRQFLDRMDKPQVDRIEGIPPAIAIDQNNPVRTSRSTVGTMTELNDHLKLLFAKAGQLYCRSCGREVQRDSPDAVYAALRSHTHITSNTKLIITFPIAVPHNFSADEIKDVLRSQGYQRFFAEDESVIHVIQDRTKFSAEKRGRITEDIEKCFRHGSGKAAVYIVAKDGKVGESLKFSSELHCAHCDIRYGDPIPNMFSFNSPIGACPACRGFGRTIGIDYDLVVPDKGKSIAEGAIKPFQTKSYEVCQKELMHFAARRSVRTDIPWKDLSQEERQWVIEGEGDWDEGVWYGVERFFQWLESKSYRMHIRVLLSKYRTYHLCHACQGARLKPESLLWRVGGKNLWEIVQMPIGEGNRFFGNLELPAHLDEAAAIVLSEIRSRLHYLNEVGVGYLTLDRQSRTLSGGEVQRINLTTALGTSLVNTLFVLDEPSIGLHSRDIRRLIRILTRLRDSGNTLLVVEHDPEVIMAADIIVDLGPAAGEAGGEVRFIGSPQELIQAGHTLTADYLSGRASVLRQVPEQGSSSDSGAVLSITGAAEHNLRQIDVDIPLDQFVCISGVSGSGKSTLIQDVLYMAIRKLKQRPIEQPGAHTAIRGHEQIDDIVMVDQSPIGKTARSNPVSYVGALDPIRSLFAKEPLSKQRGYSAGTFSFNSPKGRCPACGGSGFEHIEMQFLSDVYIRCSDCNGTRYSPEVLEVKLLPEQHSRQSTEQFGRTEGNRTPAGRAVSAKSIADVLEMTVDEACKFFKTESRVLHKLEPLRAVGLGYLRLGQPLPTLSGGESQRLKLAGHLAVTKPGRILFLFDEPTTGLHFDDIATLLKAFRQLIRAGHSLVVIEHNLDVLRACDWIIDLGPEGGQAGGEVVFSGRPDQIVSAERSYTGQALHRYISDGLKPEARAHTLKTAGSTSQTHELIVLNGAREHNLKNIELSIPLNTFTVITGVSGSGKSTIAFDILFNEGQRRYLESLNAYARQFVQPASRPEVDSIAGVPPTVAIEQRTSRGGWKSTVATVTELYHFVRLLFLRLGVQHCPECGVPIQSQTADKIVQQIHRDYRGKTIEIAAPLVVARKGYYTDLAAWAAGKGYSHLRVDGELLPTAEWPRLDRYKEHTIQLPIDQILIETVNEQKLRESLQLALQLGKNTVHVIHVDRSGRTSEPVVFSTERACPSCGRSFPELDPRLFSYNSHHGWCPACNGTGFQTSEESEELEDSLEPEVCGKCGGARLRPEALSVQFEQKSIADFNRMTVSRAHEFFRNYRPGGRSAEIARDAVEELKTRLSFLEQVGLAYLNLDRAAPTLSGGEAQRIRLAAQLGSNLRGVCYILDEPTIGLHPRDNRMLMDTLQMLKQKGNSVVVVEHDEETIRSADHVIDIGPGGGVHGGEVVFAGSVPDLLESAHSPTGNWLKHPLAHPLFLDHRSPAASHKIILHGVHAHNLKDIDIEIPVGKLIAITGVSGSGKSTLARDVLFRTVKKQLGSTKACVGCRRLEGAEFFSRALEVDQTPIGKTPRSCPATYVGFWNHIRSLFASTPEAKVRGYSASRFSFNVSGGRCEECSGQGVKRIEMNFLPDVTISCEVCGGRRFNHETLEVTYKEKTIADVLQMSVEEATEFFRAIPAVHRPLSLLNDIGLGYLTLGQQSPTLSGGEAQRLKLVSELSKAKPSTATMETLYILDEPTVGLHMADVEKLLGVLHRLVDAGNTIVIIEHNLDIIAEADWIIDLGPEGGVAGGEVVAAGTPEEVSAQTQRGYTAAILKEFLQDRQSQAVQETYST